VADLGPPTRRDLSFDLEHGSAARWNNRFSTASFARHMRVSLTQTQTQRLEELRAVRYPDPVEQEYDAFMLFGGMGPCVYVRRAGTFLVGADETWNVPETREATPEEATMSLVIAARRFEMPSLLSLLPQRPENAAECAQCHGQRWDLSWPALVCEQCHGRGWFSSQETLAK